MMHLVDRCVASETVPVLNAEGAEAPGGQGGSLKQTPQSLRLRPPCVPYPRCAHHR
jgi:hypothetical protein